jgi:broad specificity phosphatase PhoE
MTTFYICRHGETENNQNHRLSGWIDTPLTELGIKNAESSAVKLKGVKFDKIVSSDLGRAFVTAYLISRKLDFESDIERFKDLREVRYGVLANMPYESYPDLTPAENTNFIPEGGESLAQMQVRVLACLDRISADNPNKTVLIVAHDGTINSVKADFTNTELGLIDTEAENAHDLVAKFMTNDGRIESFVEV